jgi:hypothetical protein
MAWACFIISFNLPLMRYFVMQSIKCESTLRFGCKGKKSFPKIVFRRGSQNCEIRTYLEYRKMIHDIVMKMKRKGVIDG